MDFFENAHAPPPKIVVRMRGLERNRDISTVENCLTLAATVNCFGGIGYEDSVR